MHSLNDGPHALKEVVLRRQPSALMFLAVGFLLAAPETTGEPDVLLEDRDAPGMNSAEVGVFEEADEKRLRGLLHGEQGIRRPPKIGAKVLRDLPNQPLERLLTEEKLGRLLVPANFAQGHGARPETVRLLDTASG